MDPRSEYSARLDACQREIEQNERVHLRIGYVKLAIVIAGLTAGWFALKGRAPWVWFLLAAAVYLALAVWHERVIRKRTLAQRAAAFYIAGLARLDDSWVGKGNSGERFIDEKHLYAADLDLFGRGSLFELLCTARTPMGQGRLARWLVSPAPLEEIVERQTFVRELREKLDLRESIAVIAEPVTTRLDPATFIAWAQVSRVLPGGAVWAAAILLAAAAAGTALYGFASSTFWPLMLVLILEYVMQRSVQRRAIAVISGLPNAEGLLLLSEVLKRLEREPFIAPKLMSLARSLRDGERAMRRLAQIVYWIDAREGLLVRTIDFPLLYTIHVAYAAEQWRSHWGRSVAQWMDAVAEIEAVLALANYSYEHPGDPFPEFAREGPAEYQGYDLGHPLIPSSRCVRNSVVLDAKTRILLVSGSNMSGKSTLLRTVGINAVLAMAGAPVRASALQMTALKIGTRLRITDSLQENRSAFYTEILRIRDVFQLADGGAPVLFLFDELLEGTNSHDRRIGAEALLTAMVERGAIGIVTTHDLALTELSALLPGHVRNAHFQDYVEGGKMRFDYRLRDGVVTKSNALELMRLVGLKV